MSNINASFRSFEEEYWDIAEKLDLFQFLIPDNLDEEKVLGVIFNAEFHQRRRFKQYRYSGYAQATDSTKRR